MKLNVRRTVLIGFAFFSICAFWQMYNSVVPLMLTNTFHLDETFSGMIMAADNVLALFLLPFFGSLSDRCHSRLGRRMPFILVGTALAVVGMVFLPIIDNAYYSDGSGALLAAFIGVLLFVLVAMGTYRSPAVALMPDCTPKPLRSPANAIINLMGAVGGIIYLGIASVLYNKGRTAGLDHVDYLPLFVIVAAIMVASVAIVFLTVKEPKLEAEVAAYEAKHPEENLVEKDAVTGKEVLPAPVKRSLGFLLVSIALWFIGYNAMETWFTTYAQAEWGMALGEASRCLIVANVGAIVSYIPVGAIASRVGRKRTILGGIVLLGGGFAFCAAWTFAGMGFSPALYVVMGGLSMTTCMIRKHPALFAAGIAAGLGAAAVCGMAPRTGDKSVDERWEEFARYRYAHRGLHDDTLGAPENSLAAFRRAREYGFGVELDVHLTADDRLVVIHDSDLKRMTGKEGTVEELTRPQLEELRLNGTGQGIPTLGEVLRIFEWNGEGPMPAPLIIEVKTYCENADLLTSRVMECLDTFDVRYCIESFDPAVLVWLRRNRPEVIRGQLSMDFLGRDAGASAKALPLPLCVGATALLGNAAAKPDFIAYKFDDRKQPAVRLVCGLLGGKLVTWTIRSERDMLASEEEGAPVIFEGFVPAPQSCVNAHWAGATA